MSTARENSVGIRRHDALNFAYMYGYPLLEYAKYVAAFQGGSTNTLYHDRRLSTSDDFKVIRPNVDTPYTTVFLDLSSHDLVFTIPPIPDRYWVFPFYDPYGEDVANIGSLQGHQPGRYLIRFAHRDFGFFDRQSRPKEDGDDDDYLGYINFPSAYGIMLGRIAAKPTVQDQLTVNAYQDQLCLTPVRRPSSPIAPSLDLSLFTSSAHRIQGNVTAAHVVLRLTAALAPYCQSVALHDRAWIAELLARSGIYNGIPGNINLRRLHEYGESQAARLARLPGGRRDYGNGWSELYPSCKGNFKSYYQARYTIGRKGYLALSRDQALYPSLAHALVIGINQAILLRFSRRPVLRPTGFWSLTAYNAEQYLVPNRLHRYCLGDRDNMTFPDGTPLSDQSKDGEFHILLQPADITPPPDWISNWLPTPAGGGKMSITLRWYGAAEEMQSSYIYPEMEYISAITERAEKSRL